MEPIIRKAEYVTQATLITDSILMGQSFVCIMVTHSPFRKQL